MVTDKAREIKKAIDRMSPWEVAEIGALTNGLCVEIIENCEPTREEFIELVDWLLMPNWFWWDLIHKERKDA